MAPTLGYLVYICESGDFNISKRNYQPDFEDDDYDESDVNDEDADFSDGDCENEEDVNSLYRDYDVFDDYLEDDEELYYDSSAHKKQRRQTIRRIKRSPKKKCLNSQTKAEYSKVKEEDNHY